MRKVTDEEYLVILFQHNEIFSPLVSKKATFYIRYDDHGYDYPFGRAYVYFYLNRGENISDAYLLDGDFLVSIDPADWEQVLSGDYIRPIIDRTLFEVEGWDFVERD